MGKHNLSIDEKVNTELESIVQSLKYLGIKHASKVDALRFIIQENKQVRLRFRRKPKTKKEVVFL